MKKSEFDPKGRVCTKCKEFKDWSMFGNSAAGINQHMSICKVCKSIEAKMANKAVTKANKEIIKPPDIVLDNEIWVDVLNSTKYQVSNLGRLKHKKRKACVKPCRPSCGNSLVTISYLFDNGVRHTKTLGHLIAEHFVENVNNYKYITYLDKDYTNNVASNIVYTECRCEHNKPVRIDDNGRTCTKCNNFLPWDNFCYSKKGIRDKHHVCTNCCALYELDNKEMLNISRKTYYQNNRKSILEHNHLRYEKNKVSIAEKSKKSREKRKAYTSYQRKDTPTRYELFKDKLTIEESPVSSANGDLKVKCSFCGEYFKPSYSEAMSRVYALNSDNGSDNRLYCSNECKKNCPIYKVRDYQRGTKVYSNRQTNSVFRDMVLDADNHKCQMCGSESDLEVHHIIPYSVNPMLDCDIDNAITLCHNCHREKHKTIDGCGYNDLKGCKR